MLVLSKASLARIFQRKHVTDYLRLVSSSTNKYDESHAEDRARTLSQLFGCSFNTARLMIHNVNICRFDDDEFSGVTQFCKNHLKLSDLIEFPCVMSLSYNILIHRFQSLVELGCQHVRGRYLVHYPKIMSAMLDDLKKEGVLLEPKTSFLRSLDRMEISKNQKRLLESKAVDLFSQNHQLSLIKLELTSQFLSYRFECSAAKIDAFLKHHPNILLKSLREIDAMVQILTNDYNFTSTKIMKHPYLLTLDSSKVKDLAKLVPSVLDISIQTIIWKHPAIMKKLPSSLKQNKDTLEEFGFKSSQLAHNMIVLKMNPSDLRSSIEKLLSCPDFASLKGHKTFLRIVQNQNEVQYRMEELKKLNQSFPLSMLTVPDSAFNKFLVSNRGCCVTDIVQHLSEMYSCSTKAVRKHLQEYPNFYTSSALDAHKVIQFLLAKGISKEQLWNGLGIIAYEPEVVEQYFRNLWHNKEFQPISEWVKHFNFVQLLIYAINRNIYSANSTEVETFVGEEEIEEQDHEETSEELEEDIDSDDELSEISEKV